MKPAADNTIPEALEGFDDLDALLAEGLEQQRAKGQAKEDRKRLARGGMTAAERAQIEANVLAWDSVAVWETQAVVAVFARKACACGNCSRTFSHYMLHQKHRTDQHAQRWVSVAQLPSANAHFPRQVAFEDGTVPICEVCAGDDNFDLSAPSPTVWKV